MLGMSYGKLIDPLLGYTVKAASGDSMIANGETENTGEETVMACIMVLSTFPWKDLETWRIVW
jgi:hypothetical protein